MSLLLDQYTDKDSFFQLLTSESLDKNDLVNIFLDGATPKLRKASSSNGRSADGFVRKGYSTGEIAVVFTEGKIETSGITAAGDVYLSDNGGITQDLSSLSSEGILQFVGKPSSNTEFIFIPASPISFMATDNFYGGKFRLRNPTDEILLQWKGYGAKYVAVNGKKISLSSDISLEYKNQDIEEGGSVQADTVYYVYLKDDGTLIHTATEPSLGDLYANLGNDLSKRFIGAYATDGIGDAIGRTADGIDQLSVSRSALGGDSNFTSADGEQVLRDDDFISMPGMIADFKTHTIFSSDSAGDQVEIRNEFSSFDLENAAFATASVAGKIYSQTNFISQSYSSFAKELFQHKIDFTGIAGTFTIYSPSNFVTEGKFETRLETMKRIPLL